MLALRETFRVFTINALFIFERPFVFACASAGAGFGWHKCVDGYIYTKKKIKKVVLYRGLLQGTLSPVNPLQGTPSPVIPLQGTPSPVNPLQGNSYRGLRPPLSPGLRHCGSWYLRVASNCHRVHKCCAIDCARVSRRNDISEFFLEFTQDGVAHFHIKLRVLKYIPSHENIQVNIGGHQAREEVTEY